MDLGDATLGNVFLWEGVCMKWNEMFGIRKLVFVIAILCFIAGCVLTILNVMDVLARMDWLEDILDGVAWLSLGIACRKKGSAFSILCFVMSGLNLICFFL